MSYNASHGGKGDTPRPVNQQIYGNNYDQIFKKHENTTKHTDTDDTRQRKATLRANRKDTKASR
jgi:hypothetical protein